VYCCGLCWPTRSGCLIDIRRSLCQNVYVFNSCMDHKSVWTSNTINKQLLPLLSTFVVCLFIILSRLLLPRIPPYHHHHFTIVIIQYAIVCSLVHFTLRYYYYYYNLYCIWPLFIDCWSYDDNVKVYVCYTTVLTRNRKIPDGKKVDQFINKNI